MITSKQKLLDTRQELLEKKKLTKIVKEWVGDNKKIFWKYEVSCFYKTHTIRIANLPKPAKEDITVSSDNRLLTAQQKKQLSDAITKACVNANVLGDSYIEVHIDYVNGAVVAEIN